MKTERVTMSVAAKAATARTRPTSLSTQAGSTSGSCSKMAAPEVTLSTKKTRLGSREIRCTKIAFHARPSGLRLRASDVSGALLTYFSGARTTSPITAIMRSAATSSHLILVSGTRTGIRLALPPKTASAKKFSRTSTRTSAAKPIPASHPQPAWFRKEHDHQAEQGVRHNERKVQRDVKVE